MSGFSNSVVGGLGTLIRKFIRSDNYTAGSAGWSIERAGNAEFNSLTARGALSVGPSTGAHLVTTSTIPNDLQTYCTGGGLANALIGSKLPANFPLPAICGTLQYNVNGAYSFSLLVDGTDGTNRYSYVVAGNYDGASFAAQRADAIVRPAGGPTTVMVGSPVSSDALAIQNYVQLLTDAQLTSFGSTAAIQTLFSQVTTDAHSRFAMSVDGKMNWGPGTAVTDTQLYRSAAGKLGVDQLVANIAGTGETWHAFPFANGWANAANVAPFKYRLTALNEVQITGTITSPNPFNATIGTLPVGYRPPAFTDQGIWAWTNQNSGQLIKIDGNGVLTAFGSNTITTTWWVNGIIRLDA